MNNLLAIGQFSRICSLTIKALRHYDDVGLLRPAYIDRDSGYRYYSLAQISQAGRIRLLRSLEMPIEEITAYLAERDPAAQRAILTEHHRRTEAKLAECRQALALLDNLIHGGEAHMPYEMFEKQVAEQPVAGIRLHTSLDRIQSDFESTFGELFPYIARLGVRCVGAPVAVYYDPEFNKEDIDMEVCVPVDRIPAPGGRVTGHALPGAKVACTVHVGQYDKLGEAYQAVSEWIGKEHKTCAGPVREVYLVGPGMAPDPAGYRTEIQWPVK